ncbi:MAG: Fic family protein [Cardiobacteriaceae bacterium]|nr:Fic family protein [Cardiobacteriaceae bacterium]
MEKEQIKAVGHDKAIFIAQKMRPDFVFQMAQLEGNPFTFPEIQTTLSGITVGGHKLSDQQQVLDIAAGWQEIIRQVGSGEFAVSKDNFIHINTIVARHEALAVGAFRSGQVGIAGTDYRPPAAGAPLAQAFDAMMNAFRNSDSVADKAVGLFLDAARAQFFYDGNKRTGQLMMSGVLMANGFAPVTIFADAQLEYHRLMLDFYQSGDKTAMRAFLATQYARIVAAFA